MKPLDPHPYSSKDRHELLSTIFVTLLVTRKCNLNCNYCDVIYRESNNKSKFIFPNNFEKLLEFIDYQDDPFRPNLVLHFFGGEPLLNPHLYTIAKNAKNHFKDKRNLEMIMTTNLAIDPNIIINRLHPDIKVAVSFHSEYIKDESDWFIGVQLLQKWNQLHHVVLMVTENNRERILKLYKQWSKYVKCVMVPIDQFMFTEEYLTYKDYVIKELGHDPFEHDAEKDNWMGPPDSCPMCNSGLIIDELGNLYYCWPRFGNSVVNIFENPETKIPPFHFCPRMTDNCDREVLRCSIPYYEKHIMNSYNFTLNDKNTKKWFVCNA
jgi:sulfatase maturation enzyme AslB (radical SAM superfamily)